MIYLFIKNNQLRLLGLKKSLMGQFETFFFEKDYQVNFLDKGLITNVDLVASAIKESLTAIEEKEKNIYLILPQEAFVFLRTTIPLDIAQSALESFLIDKLRNKLQINLEEYVYDFLIYKDEKQSIINFYGITKENLIKFKEIFDLLECRIINIIPETIAYFKLFDKTLRCEKAEKIFYAHLTKNSASGFIFDNFGLFEEKRLEIVASQTASLTEKIKEQIKSFEENGKKLSRLIISGKDSAEIRQDTFTKEVGLWTNPLKKIVDGFYQEQIKLFINKSDKLFSILVYDACFGAFLFDQEKLSFSLIKKNGFKKSINKPSKGISFLKIIPLTKKEFFLFIISFSLSFLIFFFYSQSRTFFYQTSKKGLFFKPTPTVSPRPTATPTPTPAFKKEDLKIKILNGSGIKGKAADVRDYLKDLGYGEILTDNADNFDYKQTVIKVKKGKELAVDWLKKDLNSKVKKLKIESSDKEETADIVIIIGQDFQ